MTDTHEECSEGRDVKFCCAFDAYTNIETAAGTGWDRWQRLSDGYDLAVDGRVIYVARALGIDPHALDDHVQDRGWEYHDTGIERAIVQGAYALLHPDDNDPDGPIIVEARRGTESPSLYENIAAALAAEEVLEGACCSCPKDHEVVLAVINREIHNWEQP